jgi:hypothetical protein
LDLNVLGQTDNGDSWGYRLGHLGYSLDYSHFLRVRHSFLANCVLGFTNPPIVKRFPSMLSTILPMRLQFEILRAARVVDGTKLGKAAVQMSFAAMLVDALHTAIAYGPYLSQLALVQCD